jgi:hypothetical protein
VDSRIRRQFAGDPPLTRRQLLARAALAVLPEDDVTTNLVFPKNPLTPGPMPAHPTSSTDAWDQLSSSLYSGANPFSVVKNPAGSGLVVRNENRLDETEKHTTIGTKDDAPKGSTVYVAFSWLWLSKTDFVQKGWVLVEQLQMTGSPIHAWSVDKSSGRWFMQARDGTIAKKYLLEPVQFGHWATCVVGTYLADKPNGWTEWAMAHDAWPSLNMTRRSNIQTYQGSPGRNTIGMYAEHGFFGKYVGYIGPMGRGATASEALAGAKQAAATMGFAELAA